MIVFPLTAFPGAHALIDAKDAARREHVLSLLVESVDEQANRLSRIGGDGVIRVRECVQEKLKETF